MAEESPQNLTKWDRRYIQLDYDNPRNLPVSKFARSAPPGVYIEPRSGVGRISVRKYGEPTQTPAPIQRGGNQSSYRLPSTSPMAQTPGDISNSSNLENIDIRIQKTPTQNVVVACGSNSQQNISNQQSMRSNQTYFSPMATVQREIMEHPSGSGSRNRTLYNQDRTPQRIYARRETAGRLLQGNQSHNDGQMRGRRLFQEEGNDEEASIDRSMTDGVRREKQTIYNQSRQNPCSYNGQICRCTEVQEQHRELSADSNPVENAVREAIEKVHAGFTMEDITDLVDIYEIDTVSRRLQRLAREKEDSMKQRTESRKKALIEQKLELHQRNIKRISDERKDQAELAIQMIRRLEEAAMSLPCPEQSTSRRSAASNANDTNTNSRRNTHQTNAQSPNRSSDAGSQALNDNNNNNRHSVSSHRNTNNTDYEAEIHEDDVEDNEESSDDEGEIQ